VSGVEVHAQLLTGILDDSVPFTPRAALLMQLAWTGLAALALLALSSTPSKWTRRLQSRRVLWIPLAALALASLTFALHAAALLSLGWWVGWAHSALAIALLGL